MAATMPQTSTRSTALVAVPFDGRNDSTEDRLARIESDLHAVGRDLRITIWLLRLTMVMTAVAVVALVA